MDQKQAQALREPFPKEAIGKLPKGGVMLDYVGHAAVTDRLLQVDPEWSWEPLGVTDQGLPALDSFGNLWIRLTIAGTTRIGVGDGKSAKEAIGDAIRNAAMRFGVALDLWAKEDLSALHREPVEPLSHEEVEGHIDRLLAATTLTALSFAGDAIRTLAEEGRLRDEDRDRLARSYKAAHERITAATHEEEA